MTERSASIVTDSGEIKVGWSTLDGVMVDVSQRGSRPEASAQMHLSVKQAGDLASIVLSACRTAGTELQETSHHVSDELIELAERLRSDQKNITSADMRVAAGYLELLLKFDAGNALGAREA